MSKKTIHPLLAVRRIFTSRLLHTSVFIIAVACILVFTSINTYTYAINYEDTSTIVVSASSDYKAVLASQPEKWKSSDIVSVNSDASSRFTTLSVTESFPVKIYVDGAIITCPCSGNTVAEFLAQNNIKVNIRDLVSLPDQHTLFPGDFIIITRVQTHLRKERQTIYHETIYKGTSVVKLGRSRTLISGSNGEREVIYEDVIRDGEVVESNIQNIDILVEPHTATVLVGDGSPVSKLDYSSMYPLDANGIPINYKNVLRAQPATGYSAKAGAKGAAIYSAAKGMQDVGVCKYGTVAVNPNLIPYGTKMYIRSADGSFIYGYAVANDTGSGMMAGTITLDLFYETYLESVLNGYRIVDIYILG